MLNSLFLFMFFSIVEENENKVNIIIRFLKIAVAFNSTRAES